MTTEATIVPPKEEVNLTLCRVMYNCDGNNWIIDGGMGSEKRWEDIQELELIDVSGGIDRYGILYLHRVTARFEGNHAKIRTQGYAWNTSKP